MMVKQSANALGVAVAAALAAMSGAALAVTAGPNYVGGGATLPAIAYLGSAAGATPLVNPITAPAYTIGGQISAFGYFNKAVAANKTATKTQYCQTGSGTGKRVFYGAKVNEPTAGIAATSADAACALSAPAGTPRGFGAPSAQKFADFAGTDSPLSLTEYNAFKTNQGIVGNPIVGRGQPVQLPAVVGGIALLYRIDGVTARVNLTTAQLCGVFSGQITNWRTISTTLPSLPIKVIYRSDGSGTTFSFANYLSSRNTSNVRNVCTAAGQTFALDQTFTRVFPGGSIPATVTNFTGASGNPGVTDAVTTTNGAIGYVEAANALSAANASATDGINFATLNGRDPIRNLPEAAASLPATTLLVKDRAIGDYVVNGRPALVAVTPSGTAGCTLLADPSKYSLPTSGYPIIGISYLLFSSKGNPAANLTDLRNFGQFLTKSASYAAPNPINTINAATTTVNTGTRGYSSLPLGTTAGGIAATIQTAATACIGS